MTSPTLMKQYHRFTVLNELYKISTANTNSAFDLLEIAAPKGVSKEDLKEVHSFLIWAELIRPYGEGYTSAITHKGVSIVEQAHLSPDKPSEYFPSLKDLNINVSN